MADDGLLRSLYDQGFNDTQIASKVLGMTKDKVRHWRSRNQLPAKRDTTPSSGNVFADLDLPNAGELLEQSYIRSLSKDDNWPLPVRPIEITIPEISFERPARENFISIHYGDVHFPFHDGAALEVLYQITADLCPDLVVCHGDLLDCTQISKYEKDPRHRVSLQEEVTMAAKHLGTMAHLSPFAERWLLLGNHEDRLRRLIWDMANEIPQAQLLNLPNVWEQLSWEKLLGAESVGWEVVDGKRVLFDKLVLKHGNVVRQQSAYTARAELERYQKSGISGHTHRRGVFEKRDLNGSHAWWEHGCLCDLEPSYVSDPNWSQGFVVVTWSADRESYGVEEIRIHEGTTIFRGKSYKA